LTLAGSGHARIDADGQAAGHGRGLVLLKNKPLHSDFEQRYGRSVLTIRAMTGGAGYAQQHLQHSDYYDEQRRVRGEWQGRGAELLGLRGKVTWRTTVRGMCW